MRRRLNFNDEYSGYLKEHLPQIKELAKAGRTPWQIAEHLYDMGVRTQTWDKDCRSSHVQSIYGLVRLILYGRRKKSESRKVWRYWRESAI